ncbi:Clp protease ClpP [Roseibium denhamense]|uniref:Barstar (barnase inhibitor) domain-containing protein n=1 Tax=Roseibium denhamense TaxID=76305 RepID=A0ABY1PGK5_9HYPH|nr:Clp protease ClpP [Roseibium denhamense]MTI04095.1 Clp protease ClpP [Roseibium denhamense]SMP33615.1 hypothetical protein SAMN06265374_3789 [Roseibium denhamense]
MTLYLSLGGRGAIEQAMPRLKQQLKDDSCFDLSAFDKTFGGSDDLCEFLIFLLGGAPFYEGKPICDLLSPLCTCDDAYERFCDHLLSVFGPGTLSGAEVSSFRAILEELRPRILDPKPVKPVLVYSIEPERMRA